MAILTQSLSLALSVAPLIALVIALVMANAEPTQANQSQPALHEHQGPQRSWDDWIQAQAQNQESQPVIQNRQVSKSGRFQLIGNFLGTSDRNDLYHNFTFSFASRYHFSETHGWEIFRAYISNPKATALQEEVITKAGYAPDVQLSRFQLVTSYIFSPIYGKYAWNESSTLYFDIYAALGAGVRFANSLQPMLELGLGMNHYFLAKRLALIPEYRIRTYMEQRTSSTLVFENIAQLGVSWLF